MSLNSLNSLEENRGAPDRKSRLSKDRGYPWAAERPPLSRPRSGLVMAAERPSLPRPRSGPPCHGRGAALLAMAADNTSALKCLIEHNTNAQRKLYLEAEALSIKAQMTNLVNGWTVVPSSSVSTRLHRLLLPFSPPSSPLQH